MVLLAPAVHLIDNIGSAQTGAVATHLVDERLKNKNRLLGYLPACSAARLAKS